MKIKVLDSGFVELVSFMGGDDIVVRAARISYQSKRDKKDDARLIYGLMKRGEGGPFEHPTFTFFVRAPEVVFRHLVRYRHSSFSVQSRRYTGVTEDDLYVPDGLPDYARAQLRQTLECRQRLLDDGLAKEDARIVLPFATYLEFYWTLNARSLMNVLTQRVAPSAQWETRQYAHAMLDIFKHCMPITSAAWQKIHKPKLDGAGQDGK